MSSAVYATLTRQQGLIHELNVVANNLANASTPGYKSDRAIFSELLIARSSDPNLSISMGMLGGHSFRMEEGGLNFTGGKLDLAIQGEGFFLVETPAGQRLTRAGHFQLSALGELIDPQGNRLLSQGGAPINVPQDAVDLIVSEDGAISSNGILIDTIGIVRPEGQLQRDSNMFFSAPGFAQETNMKVVQGAVEQSNVSPVLEVARMIEVQRAYEAGQALLEKEDQRISQLISAVRER